MAADPTSTLVATGSADSTIRVWDLERGYCTHSLKGHGGLITALKFHPNPSYIQLVSGSDDTKIRVWDLHSKKCVHLLDEHASVVRGLDFSKDGRILVSGGRDQVLISWNFETGEMIKTVPIFEVRFAE
jgi:U3 small nucleolar RNA-associated protein 13